jgi:hypothetical protein
MAAPIEEQATPPEGRQPPTNSTGETLNRPDCQQRDRETDRTCQGEFQSLLLIHPASVIRDS